MTQENESKMLRVAVFAAVALVNATLCAAQSSTTSATQEVLEPWSFNFDSRPWKLGHQEANNQGSLREYVLEGETVEAWSELVTSMFVSGNDAVKDVFKRVKRLLSQDCPSLRLTVIEDSSTNVLFEWQHKGCRGYPPQHELKRIAQGRGGILSLSYVAKTAELSDERRNSWISILRTAAPSASSNQPTRTYMGHRVVDMNFPIAGGETVSLPVTDAGPIPAESPAFKIEIAGVSIDGPKQATLAWKFALTSKTSKTLEHVLVEEVHPSEVAKVLVDDPSPSLKDKIWSSTTAGIEPNPSTTAWLFTEVASVFVFRFTITPAGSPPVVLYQPAWFSPPSKEAFRQAIARINVSQPAPAPSPLPGPLKETEEVPGVSLVRHATALRKDALRNLALFAKKKYKCSSIRVVDTKHEKDDGEILLDRKGRLFSGVVSERWSVWLCGEIRALALVFRPDGKGGSYISIAEVESDK
jgi:hypothetical protein